MNVCYCKEGEKCLVFLYMFNGFGVVVGWVMLVVMENY